MSTTKKNNQLLCNRARPSAYSLSVSLSEAVCRNDNSNLDWWHFAKGFYEVCGGKRQILPFNPVLGLYCVLVITAQHSGNWAWNDYSQYIQKVAYKLLIISYETMEESGSKTDPRFVNPLSLLCLPGGSTILADVCALLALSLYTDYCCDRHS